MCGGGWFVEEGCGEYHVLNDVTVGVHDRSVCNINEM